MFEWFDKTFSRRKYPTWEDVPPASDLEKIGKDMGKVVQFPEPKLVPPMPEVKPPKEFVAPGETYYRFGLTDNDRVSFQMGYREITLNRQGCRTLIDQLIFFMNQLPPENE